MYVIGTPFIPAPYRKLSSVELILLFLIAGVKRSAKNPRVRFPPAARVYFYGKDLIFKKNIK
jgi:hypothetical protein